MKWRVGTKVPINVYEGDKPVCQCQTPEYAARIVSVMNFALNLSEGIEVLDLLKKRSQIEDREAAWR